MKNTVKVTLIAAGAVMLTGAVISAAAIALGAGKIDRGISYRTETITDKITSVNISVNYDDIDIIQNNTDKITVHCTEGRTKKYNIVSQNGVLKIENSNDESKLKWYEYINFDFLYDDDGHKMVIEAPRDFKADMQIKNSYGDVKVTGVNGALNAVLDCGDLEIENCSFSSLDCTADYGDIEIKYTLAQNINVDNNCGDIELEEVTGNITAECDLGDIEFRYISGDNLFFGADCGDIKGIIRGKRKDYEPAGTKKLETKTNLGDINIRFTE